MGAFGGHFGAIQAILGPSEAPEPDMEANLGQISLLSSAQNDLNTLKLDLAFNNVKPKDWYFVLD